MNPVTMSALDEMSRVDIRTVNPDTLVDIRDVETIICRKKHGC